MHIIAQNLPDAWFQALYSMVDTEEGTNTFKNSYLYTVQQGSYAGQRRLEFPELFMTIEHPLDEPLLPYFPEGMTLPPVADMGYVYEYFTNYLMDSHIPKNTIYTYGSRICTPIREDVTQLDLLISRLQDHPRSNQLILQIAEPMDIQLTDPPCLRSISFKVVDDRLDFHIYFRCVDGESPTCFIDNGILKFGKISDVYNSWNSGHNVLLAGIEETTGKPRWSKVDKAKGRSASNIFDISLSDGTVVSLTPEHDVAVKSQDSNKLFEIKKASQLTIGDTLIQALTLPPYNSIHSLDTVSILLKSKKDYYVRNVTKEDIRKCAILGQNHKSTWMDNRILPLNIWKQLVDAEHIQNTDSTTIGMCRSKKPVPTRLQLSYSLGYVFGAWLANGSWHGSGIQIALGTSRKVVIDKLEQAISELGLVFTKRESNFAKCYYYSIFYSWFTDLMQLLGFVSGAHKKRVPNFVFNSNTKFMTGLFMGWHDGDAGCSVSKKMISELRFIGKLAGIPLSKYINKKEGRVSIKDRTVHFTGCERLHIINGKGNTINQYLVYRKIKKISQIVRTGMVYDFNIPNTSNYLVSDGTVLVHNSNHLWSGFPVNLAAIALLMKYTLVYTPDLKPGRFVYFCSGLHLYEMDFNQAAIRLFKSDLPFGEAECCKEKTLKDLLEDMGINDTPNKEEVNVKEN